jgi:hypothetical protein
MDALWFTCASVVLTVAFGVPGAGDGVESFSVPRFRPEFVAGEPVDGLLAPAVSPGRFAPVVAADAGFGDSKLVAGTVGGKALDEAFD